MIDAATGEMTEAPEEMMEEIAQMSLALVSPVTLRGWNQKLLGSHITSRLVAVFSFATLGRARMFSGHFPHLTSTCFTVHDPASVPQRSRALPQMDANGDGVLSIEEYRVAEAYKEARANLRRAVAACVRVLKAFQSRLDGV